MIKKYIVLLVFLLVSNPSFGFDFLGDMHLISYLNKASKVDKKFIYRYSKYYMALFHIAGQIGVEKSYLISIALTESELKENAKSNKGAAGIMQVMPRTRKMLLEKYKKEIDGLSFLKPIYPDIDAAVFENICIGSLYIKELVKLFKNHDHAVIAYNMGPTWVRKNKNNHTKINNHAYLKKVNKKISRNVLIALR